MICETSRSNETVLACRAHWFFSCLRSVLLAVVIAPVVFTLVLVVVGMHDLYKAGDLGPSINNRNQFRLGWENAQVLEAGGPWYNHYGSGWWCDVSIQYGTLEPMGIFNQREVWRYTAQTWSIGECPSGLLVYLPREDIERMRQALAKEAAETQARRAFVEQSKAK